MNQEYFYLRLKWGTIYLMPEIKRKRRKNVIATIDEVVKRECRKFEVTYFHKIRPAFLLILLLFR